MNLNGFYEKIERADKTLITIVIILALLGIVMVLSASYMVAFKRFDAPYGFFYKQLLWCILGVAGFALTFYMRIDIIKKSARWLYLGGLIALVLVLILGKEMNGARRWFNLGFITFQPSEAMKLIMIVFIADYLDRKKSRLRTWGGFGRLVFFIALPAGLVLLQPDLGGAMVLAAISFAVCFLGGVDIKYLATVFVAIIIVGAISIATTPYRMARFKKYIYGIKNSSIVSYVLHRNSHSMPSPGVDEKVAVGQDLSPYKIESQSDAAIAAIRRGGWFGVGPGNSQLKMFYLPEPHTDFIFAVIGEEWGFLGALFIVILFFMLLIRSMKVSTVAGNCFMGLAAGGIAFYFTIQALFHIGVSCGLLPTKGLTLPFISFGGSSLLISFMTAGILLNISTRANK